jgi:hypothetical protein
VLLLFTNAFETWSVASVDLRTDARNAISRTLQTRITMAGNP